MFRPFFRNWWRSPQGVLTRLEGLALRGWLNAARRDPRFALSILVIAAFAIAAVVSATQVVAARPRLGLCAAALAGFFVFRNSFIAPGSARWRQLQTGILQPWTAFGPALRLWVHGRAAVMSLVVCSGITLVVLVTRPGLALAGFGSMAAGAALAAVTTRLALPKMPKPAPIRWPDFGRALPVVVRVSLAGTFRRKAGIIPIWCLSGGLWALATPASALASHNNPETHIGFAMITVIGLVCGLALAWPNLRLVRFLAFQPIAMSRIVAPLCGPQVVLVAFLAIAAAFGAGQPFGLAMVSAAVVTGGVCLWLVLLLPYAMTRSVGMAPVMAIGELFVAAIVKFTLQFGLIAVGWLVVRIAANIRAVARNRWREPL